MEWRQVESFLERILLLPPDHREAALARQIDDPLLRAKLLRLLRSTAARGDLLERSGEIPASNSTTGCLGQWRLLWRLGVGGMGEVWMVERSEPGFRQRAALKLVRPGLDTEAIVSRFRRESTVLAQLTHPGIPRLLDVGTAEDGRPYLVMEYVEGTRLDEYVRLHATDLTVRLRLFALVCDVVAHAHEHGVVHRDLKPSNVLITAAGEPKLLDFGISRVVLESGEEHGSSDLTRTGEFLLTPRYASPEQVSGGEVTVATDVHALGLILWELLVGRPALEVDGLRRADWLDTVLEREVPRPSSVLEGSTRRQRAIAGDLDTICAMALRKEPSRRYASARLLADDVRRHLGAQPVLARADSTAYRASRFVRRNRVLVGATLGVIGALVVGLVLAVAQYRIAVRAQHEAQRSTYSAGLEAAEAALRAGDAGFAAHRLGLAPEELRGWEWRHLMSRVDASLRFVPAMSSPQAGVVAWLDEGGSFAFAEGIDLVLLRTGRAPSRAVGVWPTAVSVGPRSGRIAWCTTDGRLSVAQTADDLSAPALWAADTPCEVSNVHHDVAWSPDERWLALSTRHELRLYDGATGALAAEFPNVVETASCMRIAWSPAGRWLARANWDEMVDVFDAERLEQAASWHAHSMAVSDLAFDATGTRLATCSLDQTAKVWDFATRRELSVHRRSRPVVAVCFVGDLLALGETNGAIVLTDPTSGAQRGMLVGHTSQVNSLQLSSDGRRLLSVGTSDGVRLWSVETRDVLEAETCEFVNAVRTSPDGRRFATSAPDGVLRTWDTDTCTELWVGSLDRGWLLDVDWSPDGRWIATAHERSAIGLWDVEKLEPVRVFEQEDGWDVSSVRWTRDSAHITAILAPATSQPGRVRTVSVHGEGTRDLEGPWGPLKQHTKLVLDSQDRPRLLASVGWGRIDAWDEGGKPMHLAERDEPMTAAASSADGTLLAAAYGEEVLVLRSDDLSVVTTLPTGAGWVQAIAFHPVESRLALAKEERIDVWDPSVPYRTAALSGHHGRVTDLCWTPDGRTLVSVSWDGGVRVWRSEPGNR